MTPYGAPQQHVPVRAQRQREHPRRPGAGRHGTSSSRSPPPCSRINRYPDREFTALRESLAAYLGHGLTAEQIWAANGSNEIIQQVLQAFGGPGRSVLGFPPTYSMHSIIAAGTGTAWVTAERDRRLHAHRRDGRRRDRAAPSRTSCSSARRTTPPARRCRSTTIEAAYEAHAGIVFVDEAYAEFMPADAPSALTLLPGRERLVVSRTMSKAFAFAGARVGYLAADPAVADALRLVRLPYHLSALTQAAAVAALAHAPEMLAMVDDIAAQRDRMLARAAGARATGPSTSQANFVLFGGVADPHGDVRGAARARHPDPRRRHPGRTCGSRRAPPTRRPRSSRPSPRSDRVAPPVGSRHEQPAHASRTSTISRDDERVEHRPVARPRRHRHVRHRHDRAVLRPPAHRVREALARRPDREGAGRHRHRRPPHGRGHRRSCSARRSARRSATRPGIAATATPSCRSTRRSCRRSSTSPAVPYLVHSGEPAGFEHHLHRRPLHRVAGAPRLRGDRVQRGHHRAHHRARAAATRTTSPRPSSRRSRARSARPSRSTRGSAGVPSTKGAL